MFLIIEGTVLWNKTGNKYASISKSVIYDSKKFWWYRVISLKAKLNWTLTAVAVSTNKTLFTLKCCLT